MLQIIYFFSNIIFITVALLLVIFLVIFYFIYKYKLFETGVVKLRIKHKVLLGFLVAAIAPLFTVYFINADRYEEALVGNVFTSTHEDVEKHASFVSDKFERYKQEVQFLAITPVVNKLINNDGDKEVLKKQLQDMFVALANTDNTYMQLRYIDEFGDEIVRVDSRKGVISVISEDELQNKKDRYYFTEGLLRKSSNVYVSEIDLNREGTKQIIEIPHQPVVRFSSTIFNSNSKVKGMLITNVYADTILEHALKPNVKVGAVLSSDGFYISHTQESKRWGGLNNLGTGENIINDYPNISERILSGGSGTFLFGDEILSFETVSPGASYSEDFFIILHSSSREDLFSGIYDLRDFTYISVIFALLFITIFAYIIARGISNPIRKLHENINVIRDGDYSKSPIVHSKDEIEDLSIAFSEMVASVVDARSNIEEKVDEQTKEIRKNEKNLKEQQKAVLNILDDIEQEKNRFKEQVIETEKFKRAVESSADGVVITTPDARIIYVNNAWKEVTGYSDKDVIGKNPNILKSGKTPENVYVELWNTLAKGGVFQSEDIINKRKDGSEYDARLTVFPIIENDNVIFYVGLDQNITERKLIEKTKSEFVSLASHQLRTPLSTIGWFSEMLLSGDAGKLGKEVKEYVEEIHQGNERMIRLVNDLLNVSRVDLGTLVFEVKDTNIKEVIDDILDEVKVSANSKKLKIDKKFGKDVPLLKVDPNMIRIALQNFITNAIKYTPEGGKISIEYRKQEKGVLVMFTDNGYGIPKDQQSKIFTKLFRADNVRVLDTEGTGLGLYLTKAIIEQFGGEVWFESEENKGTTFFCTIPFNFKKEK